VNISSDISLMVALLTGIRTRPLETRTPDTHSGQADPGQLAEHRPLGDDAL